MQIIFANFMQMTYGSIDTFIILIFIYTSIFINICLSITSDGSYW